MEFYIKAPKKYGSSKWNNMRVKVLEDQGSHVITVNKSGKKIRFYKGWVKRAEGRDTGNGKDNY